MASCIFCGKSDGDDKRSDHLRTISIRNHRLEFGYFRPKLHENELFVVQQPGEYSVCSNRRKCRVRVENKRNVASV